MDWRDYLVLWYVVIASIVLLYGCISVVTGWNPVGL